VILAVVFALANAVNLMTQHKASISAPKRVKGWQLALYLPRQPLWLLGVAALGRLVRLPGLGPAQRPDVGRPAAADHRADLHPMAAGVVMLTRTAPQDLAPSRPASSSGGA
jgi:hypothetical protein